ncbi:MAG: translational GTPase TypA [Candidatus Aureabacteria bacterium]|nr:translational GTPase TypA [Candidatus Auribacterota bacterium]
MNQKNIRNIAIIAHVDHGKTTLVDKLFRQSGLFRENQIVEERLMDSMDLERERGITIASKNGSFHYKGHLINIVDTPGHADFGGQVERVLKMVDGALLVVDAQEGPMPQTYFVLKKALSYHLKIIVVINKIDKPHARPDWTVNQVFDLFVKLKAPDHILDFPVIYASAKDGYAKIHLNEKSSSMIPLLDAVVHHIPPPAGDPDGPLQMQVSSIDYSSFLGRLGIGKITSGSMQINQNIVLANQEGRNTSARITKIYRFQSNQKIPVESAGMGEIVAVAGVEDVMIGDTYTDPIDPLPCPMLKIDPPTISMNFIPNDSPFSGKEGTYCTSRHLSGRLNKETLSDVALVVEELDGTPGFKVSGRGELHLSILIEKMRREGYEFQVTCPQVIMETDGDQVLEPFEELIIDVAEEYLGPVMEKLGSRKAQMLEMHVDNGMVRLRYNIPTRGLLGFRSGFMTDTKGMGVMNYVFSGFARHAGDIPRNRKNGAMVCNCVCETVAYALFNLQERGTLFYGPNAQCYTGQIVGEHCRERDLTVNPAKGKKLTNVRSAGSDENVILTPPTVLSLEESIAYINDDELVEITPKNIRLRKRKFVPR